MRRFGLAMGLLMVVSQGLSASYASAATPVEIQKGFEAGARDGVPGFTGFSAQRGEQFFKSRHGNDWSCDTCHTANPLARGRHATTGKEIAPLAPLANPQRFTVAAKGDQWFQRNGNDVLGRPCTAREKGDVMEYLISLKQ